MMDACIYKILFKEHYYDILDYKTLIKMMIIVACNYIRYKTPNKMHMKTKLNLHLKDTKKNIFNN